MFTNDLSDNGKSFEFGYDSESDTYGYYKNGVFTEFGGSSLSTKCIVKEFGVIDGSTSNGYIIICKEDGSYDYHHFVYPDYGERTIAGSAIEFRGFVNSSNAYFYMWAKALKDGYYIVNTNQPTFYQEGDYFVNGSYRQYSSPVSVAYVGIQPPN